MCVCVCVSLLGIFCHSCANVPTRFNVSSLQILLPVIILVFPPSSLSVTLFICLYPSLSVSSYEKFCFMNISFSPSYPPLLGILCGISARRIRYFEHLHTACPWPFTAPWHVRRRLQKVSICFGVFFIFWIITMTDVVSLSPPLLFFSSAPYLLSHSVPDHV